MQSALRNKLSSLVQRRIRAERRVCKRVAPPQRTLALVRAPGQDEPGAGVVQDLSLKGVALLIEREYPPGTSLHVQLVNASHTFSVALELKVARCLRFSGDQYFIAGPFDRPLAHEEVVPFLL